MASHASFLEPDKPFADDTKPLARMKRAGQMLAFKGGASVTETALDVGYDAPDAFARAFRKSFGQLPSAFRAGD